MTDRTERAPEYGFSGTHTPPKEVLSNLCRYQLKGGVNLFLEANHPYLLLPESIHAQVDRLIETGVINRGVEALTSPITRAELVRLDGETVTTMWEERDIPTIIEFSPSAQSRAFTLYSYPLPLEIATTKDPYQSIKVECLMRVQRGSRIWEATLVRA